MISAGGKRYIEVTQERSQTRAVLGFSVLSGCVFIAVMTATLGHSRAAGILLDRNTTLFPYPFTIQNFTHLLFFIGLGEIYLRWRIARQELALAKDGFLPEDDNTVLEAKDLGSIRQRIANRFDEENGFLPYLIDLCILQFYASRSVDQTVSVFNSNLELIAHRVELRYTLLRYLVWVIPTFGFIGTVVGIAWTLNAVGLADQNDPALLKNLTGSLAVAFDTTLVALILSAILVFLMHQMQTLEEKSVNLAGHYCLRNLINRLYVPSRRSPGHEVG